MLVRHAVLLTPSRSLRPPELPPASRLTKRTPILRTLFQVPYPATPLLATLTKTTGGVYQQFPFWFTPSATERNSPSVIFNSQIYSSPFFSHSCALFCTQKNSTLLFSSDSALFAQDTRGGGALPPTRGNERQGASKGGCRSMSLAWRGVEQRRVGPSGQIQIRRIGG